MLCIVHARQRSNPTWNQLQSILLSQGLDLDIHHSDWPGHSLELAREHCPGEGIVLSVGGDGTFNEVINGWQQQARPGRPSFAILSLGTGNDFARDQGITLNAQELAQALLSPTFRDIDLGRITYQTETTPQTRAFVVGATIGFSAEVTRYFQTLPRLLPGTTQYLFSLLVSLVRWKNAQATLRFGEQSLQTNKFFNLNLANTRYYGGGMYSSPKAKADSGQLEAVLMELSKLEVLKALPQNYSGEFEKVRGVSQHPIARLKLESSRPLPIQADGEFLGTTPAQIEVLPKHLSLVDAPKGG